MEVRYFKGYSYNLNREMEFKVYGHRGKPVLFIPCQAGRFYDFENFHMDDVFRPYIDAGEIMVFSIDTIDNETWADHGGNPRARIEQHERWFNYIVDEMVPQIRHLAGERNWCQMPIMPFGCSMGAMHAANLFFRRPDLFDSVLALSGVYDSFDSFGDYMDDLVYRNSPYHYLSGMSDGSPVYPHVQRAQNHPLRRPGRVGRRAQGKHLAHQGRARRQGHPRVGGLLGLRRRSRLGLVVQAGRILPALPAGKTINSFHHNFGVIKGVQ